MKVIVILCIAASTFAVPTKLHFRNLFRDPVNGVVAKPNPKIIGGQEAKPHSIPYQAFLEVYGKDGGWFCGGSLISENYILTAGHCGVNAIEAHITLGAHKYLQKEDTQDVLVSKEIKVHDQFDSVQIINDIAIIKLPEPIGFTTAIKPIALPKKNDVLNSFEGSFARVSGWGITDGFGNQLSEVLNYVDVEVIGNKKCEDVFNPLSDSIVCTSGDKQTGSCSGDSGGPLIVDGVQIGIVSFGVVYCLPGYPSAFTRVTSFLDWIENNTDVKIK